MVAAGQLVELTASASDSDGSVSRYLWSQDSGDSVIIEASDSASASFSMPTKPQSETLVFIVTVTDNGGLSASDSITITHENAAPTVDAGSDQNVVAGATAILSGSAEDGDGDIISYAWTQTSGDSVTLTDADQAEASFTLPDKPASSTFAFVLTVTDNRDASASDSVNVAHDNALPVVDAGSDQNVVAGATAILSGSAEDGDGDIISYAWTQTSGDSVTLTDADQAEASFTLPDKPASSTFAFVLTVTDNRDASASDSVNVAHDNALPVVDAGSDQSVVANTRVTLTASATDSDGDVVSFGWAQIAGDSVDMTGVEELEAIFRLPEKPSEENFVFAFTATDNHGGKSTDSLTVAHINAPPTVSIEHSGSAEVGQTIMLTGNAEDSDGDIVAYAWRQTTGVSVAIDDTSASQISFVVPSPTATEALSFSLSVTDNRGATSTAMVTIAIQGQIGGRVTFDLVPLNPATSGLDYANTRASPARGLVVELRDADNTVLATTVTDAQGRYGFAPNLDQSVRVRVTAQLKNAPHWEVKVIDNTSGGALYVGQTALFEAAADGADRNLHFASGWGGSSYTEVRSAAPFAILDAVYAAMEKFRVIDNSVVFPLLQINWSENNRPADGEAADGDIGTSYYYANDVYILGAADSDTDEYDRHVVIHEWGHYFEDKLSRSDSIGGDHSGSDRLDLRVAFGEGWGNALSAMITDDRYYRDSYGSAQSNGFAVDIERNQAVNRGWFNESSVQSILYDLYNADSDGADQSTLGLGPIYRTLVSATYRNTPWLTSIFSFVEEFKTQQPNSGIEALLAAQGIDGVGGDGAGETHNGGIASVLPVYRRATVNGASLSGLCAVIEAGSRNKLGNRVFVSFKVLSAGAHNFVVTQIPDETAATSADIDFYIYRRGVVVAHALSAAAGEERATENLAVDDYVMAIYAFENDENLLTADTCFDLQISR